MSAVADVGLFVDFESYRQACVRASAAEPDCQVLMEKARKYGPVAVAYAYADFSVHPPTLRRKLEIAGLTPRDVPRRTRDPGRESSANMAMLMDVVDCLLDRPNVQVLVMMTGDPDFVRVIARARHRFGKKVVISGPEQNVSVDLIESADVYDPLPGSLGGGAGSGGSREEPQASPAELRLLQLVDWLATNRPYMTFSFIRSHALSPHHGLDLSDDMVTEILSHFKERGILIEGTRLAPDGRTLRTLQLNERHSVLALARRREAPTFEAPNGDVPEPRDNGAGPVTPPEEAPMPEAPAEAEAEVGAELETETEAELETELETETEAEAEAEVELGAELETGAGAPQPGEVPLGPAEGEDSPAG